ncbi:MAG: NAD-glutamate dehydrogenase [Rhodocyclaceae bacterium]|nr:NAD-glutamate dehydrogenase [Rhodocyclaceae bacterium]
MTTKLEEQKQQVLDEVVKLLAVRVSTAEQGELQKFVLHYFSQVDAEDIITKSAEDLYGAALAHYSFARSFSRGTAKLRVYNPKLEAHGWESTSTVVEIINDDMPFLVDSVTMEVNRLGYRLAQLIHPMFRTQRDASQQLQTAMADEGASNAQQESFIHIEINRETDPARLHELEQGLAAVLDDVRAAVVDWQAMRTRMAEVIAGLSKTSVGLSAAEVDEGRAFLEWALDNHFTFLGYREYDLTPIEGSDQLTLTNERGLGILHENPLTGTSTSFAELPLAIRRLAREAKLLVLTKATSRSTVHRPGYLDYIGIKRFNAHGEVVGERRFVGLYTSSAYQDRLDTIPIVRNKASAVLTQAGFASNSHMGKNLVTILETFPRDELFQIDQDALLETAMGILRLGDRRKLRVFVRRDVYGRFYSCLIFLPRDQFNTESRTKIQEILKRTLRGQSVEFTVQLSDALLARIHMLIRTAPSDDVLPDARAIETEITLALRDWSDDLKLALIEAQGEEAGNLSMRRFANAFPAAYTSSVSARAAVHDIDMIDGLSAQQGIRMSLYRPVEADSMTLRLRVYRLGQSLALSESLPMLEHMGVAVQDEQSFVLNVDENHVVHIHDFGLKAKTAISDISAVKPLFEAAFGKTWHRVTESDGFNRLVLVAGLASEEVLILRALAKYLKQTGFTFSQAYIEQTLGDNAVIARQLVALFHARFNPAATGDRAAAQSAVIGSIRQALDAVANADEDRILRRFLALIQAVIRTNFYQSTKDADGISQRKPYISFKIESAKVPELPEPKPLYEIWVYSPRIEGIHLRFGKVARGGLRWSDRMEDFRTEVLGLVKAQQVKNAVIVPVGSKGGFVVKNPPPASDRDAYLKEGIECYKTFLRGLLDITDNLVANQLVAPKDVVRHDADDPYLVVAADKGTASFSDYANAVSAEYGHWLGDAFASGGSVGYDHKKMGITARGAWESVKRHFLEIGVDTQTTAFTVVGVGDMSGDVFGNGMLLSRHIKLLAAFDHRHIFLDPNPDTEISFKERERMFSLPRSSWDDYDKSLISVGGGVYPRSAKTIALTPEVKQILDVEEDSLSPTDLMRAILKAKVDLFYNGGIGTYVKASTQRHAEVGDRATDALRVNGNELRCKVVAEGGNLGCTQLGRIEYALHGGRINTDAIDNSAGVDCSDHEVNIKILLGIVEAEGELTEKQRNKLLAEMTDEVGLLVLQDNYYQTQSLSVSGVRGDKALDAQARFIRHLEKIGRLNRAVEFLPSDEEIDERRAAGIGLTSPEGAVLLAYSKMVLFDQLIASKLIDDAYVGDALIEYFPAALRQRYASVMQRHPLKREIIATVVANTMINHTGSIFAFRMVEETGAAAHDVVKAYMLVRDIFGFNPLWTAIESLDRKVSAQVQNEMLIDAGRLMLRAVLWFLREHQDATDMQTVVANFQPGVEQVRSMLPSLLTAADLLALLARQQALIELGVPAQTADIVAGLDAAYAALDIVKVAGKSGKSVDLVAQVYFSLVGKLEIRWFAKQITALPTDTHWQALARNAMRDDLSNQQRQLTLAVVSRSATDTDAEQMIAGWEQSHTLALSRIADMVNDFKSGAVDLAMLSVVLRELRGLG